MSESKLGSSILNGEVDALGYVVITIDWLRRGGRVAC